MPHRRLATRIRIKVSARLASIASLFCPRIGVLLPDEQSALFRATAATPYNIHKEETMLLRRMLLPVLLIAATQPCAAEADKPDTTQEKYSYTLGYTMMSRIGLTTDDIDVDQFTRAIRDAVAGQPSVLSDAEMQAAMTEFRQTRMKQKNAAAEENKKTADEFLAKNGAKAGVVTLPSGLQYTIVEPGTGKQPQATDNVEVHYRGQLLDGTEFDSSYKRGKPATFRLNQVIKGWQEGLQLMKEGATWQLYIPPSLGYGPNGQGATIPPNALLVFDVELIKIK